MFELEGRAELASKLEVVLGAKAYDLDNVVILSRKLRNVGSFAPAGRSMRREEPEQDWPVAIDSLVEGRNITAGYIEHFDIE